MIAKKDMHLELVRHRMIWNAQRLFPVPYHWRRIGTLAAVAVGLTVGAKLGHVSLLVAAMLTAVYPLALLPLGFLPPGRATTDPPGRAALSLEQCQSRSH